MIAGAPHAARELADLERELRSLRVRAPQDPDLARIERRLDALQRQARAGVRLLEPDAPPVGRRPLPRLRRAPPALPEEPLPEAAPVEVGRPFPQLPRAIGHRLERIETALDGGQIERAVAEWSAMVDLYGHRLPDDPDLERIRARLSR